MKGSLQEQLLKSGLINEEQLNKPKKQNKKPKKQKRKPSPKQKKPVTADSSSTPAELKKQKEQRVEVKKCLRSHKINDKTGEIAYNYSVNNKIKRFFVTEKQQKSLIEGVLAIVNWNGISYLIPVEAIEELRALYPKIEACIAKTEESRVDKDDPYADYVIPDDIKW